MLESKPAAVNLKRKIKHKDVWTFVPVARKNGHYVADRVLIDGVPTKVDDGTFYIEWRQGGKRIQKSVGKNGHEAVAACKNQNAVHALRSRGMAIEEDTPQIAANKSTDRSTLSEVIETYLEDNKVKHRPKTLAKYAEALNDFLNFAKKRYVDELQPDDIRGYLMSMQLDKKLAPKTAKVKGRIVHGVLSGLGASLKMKQGDWPKVTKKSGRKMYRTDTLKRLLSTVSRERYILWSFFLHTGFREQEVAFCSWADVDWTRGEISVTEKKRLGFEIKNYEERTVPVVEELMELLKEHRKTLPKDAFFIFPTKPAKGRAGLIKKGGKNMLNMLDLVKTDYLLAGLNCGTCEVKRKGEMVTCVDVPQCKKAGLHMFRHTYATNLLRAGFSLPDVSKLLGHQDVATTQIYLHSLENEDIRSQVLESGLGQLYTPDEFRPVEHKRIHVVSDEARRRMSEGGKRSAQVKAEMAAH